MSVIPAVYGRGPTHRRISAQPRSMFGPPRRECSGVRLSDTRLRSAAASQNRDFWQPRTSLFPYGERHLRTTPAQVGRPLSFRGQPVAGGGQGLPEKLRCTGRSTLVGDGRRTTKFFFTRNAHDGCAGCRAMAHCARSPALARRPPRMARARSPSSERRVHAALASHTHGACSWRCLR